MSKCDGVTKLPVRPDGNVVGLQKVVLLETINRTIESKFFEFSEATPEFVGYLAGSTLLFIRAAVLQVI